MSRSSRSPSKIGEGLVQSLSEKIAALTVSLDDKHRLCALLRDRIRLLEQEIENGLSEEELNAMRDELQDLMDQQRRNLDEAMAHTAELVEKKRFALRQCESAIQGMQALETQHQKAVEDAVQSANLAMTRDKAEFAAGSDDRFQRRVSSRLDVLREEIRRGLEPDIQRLQQQYTQQMAEIESSKRDKSRRIQEEIDQRRSVATNRLKLSSPVSVSVSFMEKYQDLQHRSEKEHHQAVQMIMKEIDSLHQSATEKMNERLEKERALAQQQVLQLQDSIAGKQQALRSRHQQELADLQRDYDKKV